MGRKVGRRGLALKLGVESRGRGVDCVEGEEDEGAI